MLQINEALEILSNPGLRADYDRVLSGHGSAQAAEATEAAVREARTRAENYPRDWKSFESWVNWFASDAGNAEYGSIKLPFDIEIVTAGKSITGWIFIIFGSALGVAAMYLMFGLMDQPGLTLKKIGAWCVGTMFGSMLGGMIHNSVGKWLLSGWNSGPPSVVPPPIPPTVVHACPTCGQKARIPKISKTVKISCPKCGNGFIA